ncbi:uncharacterized protein SRS1_11815 [Sporisorium reilianum f. sp. reilianum]|uniref:Transmembrane protein n=1 Tax=Sporisorium reilianum f. sp. reilianum TaxID=72559 RepID=A0A2N8U695_9BASI|nr:uncharacterized protein SRS1_11815 [Sporisorium reilianum f. sp. reilianum]
MANLSTRGLLFILGCCLGWQLCSLCGQLFVLSACFLILALLFRNNQIEIDESEDAQPLNSQWFTAHNQAYLVQSVSSDTIGASQTPRSPRKRTRKPHKPRHSAQYHGDDEGGGSRITLSPDSTASAFPRPAYAHRPSVTQRGEQDVIRDWLNDVDKAQDEDRPLLPTPVLRPAATNVPTVPLTAKRLAQHLGSPHGGIHTGQVRIDASDCSSSSDPIAGSPCVQRRTSFIPIRRIPVSKGSSTAALASPTNATRSASSFVLPTLDSSDELQSNSSSFIPTPGSRDTSDASSPGRVSSFDGESSLTSRDTTPFTSYRDDTDGAASLTSKGEARSRGCASTATLHDDAEEDNDISEIDKLLQQVDVLLQQSPRAPKTRAHGSPAVNKQTNAGLPSRAAGLRSMSRSADEAVTPSARKAHGSGRASTGRLLDLVARLNE